MKTNQNIMRIKATERGNALIRNIEKVIIGKPKVVFEAVCSLLAQGHILLEDIPGVGKTMLAKAIAKSIGGEFKRVQFTADLLPSDISGVTIYHQKTGEFRFRKGPVFANILLGDEINRATPRTQSSLLEVMEEKQLTVDGTTYDLQEPFLVIATQNPIELEGTYPLPFAQMDRFMVRFRIGYLELQEEVVMLEARINGNPIETCTSVISCAELVNIQDIVRQITVTRDLLHYIVSIIHKTRSTSALEYGSSPRGALDILRFSQAIALMNDRDYMLPDDIKRAAPPVLSHRVIVKRGTRHATLQSTSVIEEIVESTAVPV